jgi:hypothetical protein
MMGPAVEDLSHSAPDQGLPVAGHVVCETEPRPERVLLGGCGALPVVAQPEIQRELAVDRPFVRNVRAQAVINDVEVELPHADLEAEWIGGRIGGVEGPVGREREVPDEIGGRARWLGGVAAERHASLERVLAGPARLEPGERVVDRDVADDVLRVGVPIARDVIRMRILRADVERLEPVESDELPAMVEERRLRVRV